MIVLRRPSFGTTGKCERRFQMLVHPQQITAYPRVRALGGALGAAQHERGRPRRHTIAAREQTRQPRPAPTVRSHELVLQGRHRLIAAGIALPSAPPEELTIDAPGLVTLG